MNPQNPAMWEERLSDGLSALAESEAPAATVTVADVLDSGRRRLRRRTRTFALAGALVSTAALAVGVLAVAGPSRTGGTQPTGSSSAHPPAAPSADPLAPILAFGWLPASLNGTYAIQQSKSGPDYNHAAGPTGATPMDGPGVSMLQVWSAAGAELTASVSGPGSGMDPGSTKIPAGTVQGRQAWWMTGAPGTATAEAARSLELEWQYEPNAWAQVTYQGQTDTATAATVIRVADNLVIGPYNPTALPFSLKKIPAGMHVDAADVNLQQPHGSTLGVASLRICVKSPCSPGTGGLVVVQQAGSFVGNSVLAAFDAPLPDTETGGTVDQGTPVTVNGYAARLWTNAKGATVTFNYAGANVTISAADTEYQALGGVNGFLAFCRSLSWYGANPSHWTTDVIR